MSRCTDQHVVELQRVAHALGAAGNPAAFRAALGQVRRRRPEGEVPEPPNKAENGK